MKIYRTNKVEGHFHLVMIDPVTMGGVTSEDQKHRHTAVNQMQAMPTVDPMTGAPLPPPPFRMEDWVIAPDPMDGHTHEIRGLEADTKTGEDKDETSAECVKLFLTCIDRETESRQREDESEAFYMGDQWDESTRLKLMEKDRAAVTINHCEGVVDDLVGYLRQNRRDFMVLPTEGTDQKAADLWTQVLKIIAGNAGMDAEEDMGFEDLVVMGREVYKVYPTFDGADPEIAIERTIPRDVYFGYHERPDMKDCHVMIQARWMSGYEVKELWPEVADEVDGMRMLVDEPIDPEEGAGTSTRNPALFDAARKEIRVYEIWRKEFGRKPLLRFADGSVIDGLMWRSAEAAKARTLPDVEVEWKPAVKYRKTTMAGTLVLEDEYPEIPQGVDGMIFGTYAKYRRNRWWGKLEAGKDPQREINKRHSQSIDVLNKVAPYGYFYDKRTFPNEQAKDKFKNDISSPGFMVEISDQNRPPKLAEGVKTPVELINGITNATEKFFSVLSHSRAWLNAPADVSGDALEERRRAGMTANEFLYDNHAKLKRRIGKAIIAWVQQLYSPERIARMVIGRANEDMQIDGQAATEFTMEDIISILENTDATKFDITVAESPWNPTARRANFQKWADLRKNGVPVPDDVIIDMADMPLADRKKIKGSFNAQQQAQIQMQQDKMKMELGKTAIAKGVDPAAIAGQGQPPQGAGQ